MDRRGHEERASRIGQKNRRGTREEQLKKAALF
jgi:hypothetical protein